MRTASTIVAFLVASAFAAGATALPPGVELVRGTFERGRQPDGNSVLFRAPQGLVLVDTGRHPAHGDRVLDRAAAMAAPIAVVVSTHWHLDHVSGNPRVRAAHPGLEVLASGAIADAMQGFLADYRRQLETVLAQRPDDAQAPGWRRDLATIESGAALFPDLRIDAAGPRTLAGRRFQIGLETHAVTGGDVWLFDPQTRVLAAGDLVTLPAPLLDTACPARWQAALERLAAVDFDWLVPGHGAPMRRADFARYRAAYAGLLDCAASDADAAGCTDGWLDAVRGLVPADDEPLARDLLGYYLAQRLRGEGATRDCPAATSPPG